MALFEQNMDKQKMVCGIYRITSPVGLVYIGATNNMYRRLIEHKYRSKFMVLPLYESYREHGIDKHKVDIIHELPLDVERDIMDVYEQFYYKQYKECGIKMLNSRDGGSCGKLHDDHKNKIRNSLIGKFCGNKNAMYGVKHTESTKALMSELKKGKIGPNFGKRFSDETKAKMRESALLRHYNIKK